MILEQNILVKPEIFPIIGENNKAISEISRRFAKYYRKGIKSKNKNKLLGYNLKVPKAFSKLETVFVEEEFIMEIKINSKSSIIVPSIYTSKNTLEELFQLESNLNLKDLYLFKENKVIFKNKMPDYKLYEAVGDPVGALPSSEEESKFGYASKSQGIYGKIKNLFKGKAGKIKQFTKDYLRKYYPEDTSGSFLHKLMNIKAPGIVPNSISRFTSYTIKPLIKIAKFLSQEISGNKDLKNAKLVKKISAKDINELKQKTSGILKEIYSDSSDTDAFINEVVKIYDNPDNISGWLESINKVNCRGLVSGENEIFEGIMKDFSGLINFGENVIYKQNSDIPAYNPEDIRAKGPRLKGKDSSTKISGILRFMNNKGIKKVTNKIRKQSKSKHIKAADAFDFDDLVSKINTHTKDGRIKTSKQSESFLPIIFKRTFQFIAPFLIANAVYVLVSGQDPIEKYVETGMGKYEKTIEQEYVRDENKKFENFKSGYTEIVKKQNKILDDHTKSLQKINDINKFIMSGSDINKICRNISSVTNESLDDKTMFFIEFVSYFCSNGYPNNTKISDFKKYMNRRKSDNKEYNKFMIGISKHLFDKNVSDVDEIYNNTSLKKKIFLVVQGNLGKSIFSNPLALSSITSDMTDSIEKGTELKIAVEKATNTYKEYSNENLEELNKNSEEFLNKMEKEYQKEQEEKWNKLKNNKRVNKQIENKLKRFDKVVIDRWKKNIDEKDSNLIAAWRQFTTLPIDILAQVVGNSENLLETGTTFGIDLQKIADDPKNANRTKAGVFLAFCFLLFGYARFSSKNLAKRVVDLLKEIAEETNVFRVIALQIAIDTIQVVLYASVHKDFQDIIRNADDENNIESEFKPNEREQMLDLLENLNNVTCKPVNKTVVTTDSDGNEYKVTTNTLSFNVNS